MNITKKETEKNRSEYKKDKITEKDSARKKQIKILKIILAILAAGIIIGAIIYFIPVMKGLTTTEGKIAFKNKIQRSGFLGMLSLFGLQLAQMFLFILPGEPIEIVAGMCYGGFWGTVFIMATSAIISIGIFFIVRKLGRKFVYEFSDENKVKKIENSKLFQDPKRVEIIMFILFLIPGTPKDLLVYIAGLLPIKPGRFILISTFAKVPSIVSSTYAGAKILEGNWKMGLIVYGSIIAIVLTFIAIMSRFDKNKVTKEAINTIK